MNLGNLERLLEISYNCVLCAVFTEYVLFITLREQLAYRGIFRTVFGMWWFHLGMLDQTIYMDRRVLYSSL